jgi:MYXO-CTERM domain-containing protein
MRAISWALAAVAAAIGTPARAADIAVLAWTQNAAQGTRTLRLPRTGSFTMDKVADGYLIVGVAMTGDNHAVSAVTWSGAGPTQAFHVETHKIAATSLPCRTELWGLADPAPGAGFVTVTVQPVSGSPPAPALAGAIISFSNVASTSTNGPCCVNATNSGDGNSTINKTMFETSRGDALVHSVCTQWSGGTAPGMPGPDPANDPEMVPRTFQMIGAASLQHFTGTSPGADVDRPATSYRHLRWLQSGSRTWAIAGLAMQATATIAVPPPDAAAPAPDAAPAVDAAPAAPDAATLPPDLGPTDVDPPGDPAIDPPDAATPTVAPDGEADPQPAAPDAEIAPVQRQISLQVGCACDVGSAPAGGGLGLLLVLAPLLRRRPQAPRE